MSAATDVRARLVCPASQIRVQVAADLVELVPGPRRQSPWFGGRVRWDCPCGRYHDTDTAYPDWFTARAAGARVLPAPVWVTDSGSWWRRVGAAFGWGVR